MGSRPGYRAAQAPSARRQGSYKVPTGGILAAASRNASPASKKSNPRLRKVR